MTDETTKPGLPLDAVRDARRAEIYNRFTYHPPKPGQPERYQALREKALELALLILDTTPASREQSTALTHLETAIFWANAGIARNE